MRTPGPRYIAVEGPIGSGKTSLANILGESLSARVVLDEQAQPNPFLGDFYRDRQRHAMSTQLFFLLQRYTQQGALAQGDLFSRGGVVSDYIFAKDRLFALLNLSPDEMALYDRIYQMLKLRTVTPDLSSTCRRGPKCSSNASASAAAPRSAPSGASTWPKWRSPTPSTSSPTPKARC